MSFWELLLTRIFTLLTRCTETQTSNIIRDEFMDAA